MKKLLTMITVLFFIGSLTACQQDGSMSNPPGNNSGNNPAMTPDQQSSQGQQTPPAKSQ